MKLLVLARYGALGASSRMRMYQYLPALEAAGASVRVAPLLRDDYVQRLYAGKPMAWAQVAVDYGRRLRELLSASRFDLLWVEKELFPMLPAWGEQLLQRSKIPWVVDYDDAVFLRYTQRAPWMRLALGDKIERVMRHADLVVAGNQYLAHHAQRAGARWVEELPTVVDLARYPVRTTQAVGRRRGDLVVGWIGSPATVHYLALIASSLVELGRYVALRLRVVGASFSWPGLRVEECPWTEDTEVAQVQQFDIGIMPLADTEWERGKCAYKLIQCMACGVPVVASAIGANRDVVEHGRQGYLAQTPEQWLDALRLLAQDPVRAAEMGAQGRERVRALYCLEQTAPRLTQWFQRLVAGR